MRARLALPLALGLALAAPSLGFGFLADDFTLLRFARDNGFARFFRDDFSGRLIFESDFYRPLVTSLLRVEVRLWGLWPLGCHLVNVALFLLGIVLCVALLRELGVAPAGQLVGGAVFAVIPSHVASVGWVSDVGDVLVGALILLAAIAAVRAGVSPHPLPPPPHGGEGSRERERAERGAGAGPNPLTPFPRREGGTMAEGGAQCVGYGASRKFPLPGGEGQGEGRPTNPATYPAIDPSPLRGGGGRGWGKTPAFWSAVAALAVLGALLTKETGALAVPLGVLAFGIGRARSANGRWRAIVPDGRAMVFAGELVLAAGVYLGLRLTSGVGDPLGAGRFARGFGDYEGNVRYLAQISIGALDGTRDGPFFPWRLVGIAAVVLLLVALKGARPSLALGFGLVWLGLAVGLNAVTAAPWLAYVPSIGVALVVGASWSKPNRDALKLVATVGLIALDLAVSGAWSARWGQASTIARQTVDALVQGQVEGFVLDVPFDYVDVPVFPNGLEDAVFLDGGRTVHPVVYYAGRTPNLRAKVQVLSPSRVELGVVPGDPGGNLIVGHDRYVGSPQQAEALGLRFTRVAAGPDGVPALEVDCGTRAWVLSSGGLIRCGPAST